MAKSLRQVLEEVLVIDPYVSFPLLPVGGMLLLVADAATFKSMLAMNMGLQLATKLPLLGDAEHFKVEQFQRVLYIEQEIGPFELKKRLKVMAQSFPVEAEDNFFCVSKNLDITLSSDEGKRLLMDEIEAVKPTVLILDPFREFHSEEENSSTDIVRIVKPLRRYLAKEGISLIVVHHIGKPSEWKGTDSLAASRGSNYLTGAANTVINLTRPNPDVNESIRLTFSKCRSDKPPYPRLLRFDEATHTFSERKRTVAA